MAHMGLLSDPARSRMAFLPPSDNSVKTSVSQMFGMHRSGTAREVFTSAALLSIRIPAVVKLRRSADA